VIIDPRTEKTFKSALDKAIDELKYGSVCINHWPALSYGLGSTTWGAYPGHARNDIQSGTGVVHNTYLLEDVEKTVISGPFTVWPKPPWFVTHKRSTEMAKVLVETATNLKPLALAKLFYHALRG
jgi:aldehyde dehydrogenase (NAD(P)+)